MRMRKKLTCILLAALLLLALFVLAGCHKYRFVLKVTLAEETEFTAEVGMFDCTAHEIVATYSDGTSEKLPMTEEMFTEEERLKFYKAGEQEITFTYGDATATFKLNVTRHVFDSSYSFDDISVTYDGTPHSLRVQGELPEGARVSYPNGNSFTDVGEYPVKAVILKDGFETVTVFAVMTVIPADLDMSAVTFEDTVTVYNGEPKTVEAEHLPAGVAVTYTYYSANGSQRFLSAVSAGEYRVVAQFTYDNRNYNPIPERSAILTIRKAVYDTYAIRMEDATVPYDTTAHSLAVTDPHAIPEGVACDYHYYDKATGEEVDPFPVNAGVYEVRAVFRGNVNYEEIEPVSATLTVEKITVNTDHLRLYTSVFDYNGEPKSLAVTGEVPDTVTVNYENNGQTKAGTYAVTARIVPTDAVNYTVTKGMLQAELIINAITENVFFSMENIAYDTENGIHAVGLPEGVIADIRLFDDTDTRINVPAHWQRYHYVASFSFADEAKNESTTAPDVEGTAVFFDTDMLPDGATVQYTGEDFGQTRYGISPAVPAAFDVTYNYEIFDAEGTPVETAEAPGTYLIRMTLAADVDHASRTAVKEVTLTVEEVSLTFDPADLRLFSFTYDGEPHKIDPSPQIPLGIHATWTLFDADDHEIEDCYVSEPGIYHLVITLPQNPYYNEYASSVTLSFSVMKITVTDEMLHSMFYLSRQTYYIAVDLVDYQAKYLGPAELRNLVSIELLSVTKVDAVSATLTANIGWNVDGGQTEHYVFPSASDSVETTYTVY